MAVRLSRQLSGINFPETHSTTGTSRSSMAAASAAELQPVEQIAARLQSLLDLAKDVKPERTVEPPLSTANLISGIDALPHGIQGSLDDAWRQVIVENAVRQLFYSVLTSADITDPAFVDVWNLLDILHVCGDRSVCAPELACQLIEELLDSQTTDGCRTVFDYLESRRERLAANDFHKKNLTLLRACNELLRRLSRAEDAVFCGRVFFFLFQTFPLGDKSSVNLRGEFHTENLTKFEVSETDVEANGDRMDVDTKPSEPETPAKAETPQAPAKPAAKGVSAKAPKKVPEEKVLSTSELYPIFWQLQRDFSDPTRLFASDSFQSFKQGLASTMLKFKKTPPVLQTKAAEDSKRGVKRKLGSNGTNGQIKEQSVDNYNPKYLTSRELFDLELSDLAFQRHIMVQALILIDFLLSLTERAKKKIAILEAEIRTRSQQTSEKLTLNKSLLYSFTLSKEDTEWATTTRTSIKGYLTSMADGRMFDRMVDTVLARDRNWVRWKIESCPSIVKDPVSTEQIMEARKAAREYTKPRRVPEHVRGAMNLNFLDEGSGGGLDALRDPSRFTAPAIEQLLDGMQNDNLDLDMAMGDAEKASLETAISNKTWRALRQARAINLDLLDKVEPGKSLEHVFRPTEQQTDLESVPEQGGTADGGEAPAVTITDEGPQHDPMDIKPVEAAITTS